jgi:hypothetical protein
MRPNREELDCRTEGGGGADGEEVEEDMAGRCRPRTNDGAARREADERNQKSKRKKDARGEGRQS